MLIKIAEACEKANLFEDAAYYLELAIKKSPDSAYIHNKRGILYRKMKCFNFAEDAFNRALSIDRADPYIYYNLSRLYADWEKWLESKTAAQKALDILPDFKEAVTMYKFAAIKLQAHTPRLRPQFFTGSR
ncbi:hypothetical protein LJB93_03295 [Desulfovibrio sp. OttesenSCG-928-F07]|nr:hypothetical protein [Desulfovibrio sp. OttesenSCG-928-F07]